MKIAIRRDKVRLSTLLEQRATATTVAERGKVARDIARLVCRPLKLQADGDTPNIVANLAQGLTDYVSAGRFGPDVSAIQALEAVATERGLDPRIPAEVAERLSKLV